MRWIAEVEGGERKYRSDDGRFSIVPAVVQSPTDPQRRRVLEWLLFDRRNEARASGTIADCKEAASRSEL